MKAVLDVHYIKNRSIAACVVFDGWGDPTPLEVIRATGPEGAIYQPGKFYLRELPFLISVLDVAPYRFDVIVIDGYIHLKSHVGKGLGRHLFESVSYSPVVIGVAKNPLKVADRFIPICRGRSKKPLFVSAVGCTTEQAACCIASMHGPYRIPTLLKTVDRHARA